MIAEKLPGSNQVPRYDRLQRESRESHGIRRV